MVLFHYATRELTAKIVYYGPGLCGKTTNLQYIHDNLPGEVKGKMLSLATKTDRTLFFDFLPIDLGEIRGMKTRIQLYTVPGQVFYNETRKLVLKGADGIVFVADSQEQMLGANIEAFRNLEENLKANGLNLADMPHVLQFNKRDLPRVTSIEELNTALNRYNAPFYESVATAGIGVQDTLRAIVKLVLLHLTRKYDPKAVGTRPEPPAPAPPTTPPEPRSVPFVPSRPEPAPIEVSPIPLGEPAPPPPPPRVARPASAAGFFARGDEEAFGQTLSGFEETEIASLIEEVAEEKPQERADEMALSLPETEPRVEPTPAETEPAFAEEPPFEIDRAFDREWAEREPPQPDEPTGASAPDEATLVLPEAPAGEEAGSERTVLLTEVARDSDLFEDPSVEVARLRPGDTREIEVPVELVEGEARRRFRLSVRLRLDPVD